jgi:hypothetical protein
MPTPQVAQGRIALETHPGLHRAAQKWKPDLVFSLGTLGNEMIGVLESLAQLGATTSLKITDYVGRGNTAVCRDLLKLEKLGWVARVGSIVDGRMCSIWRLTVAR